MRLSSWQKFLIKIKIRYKLRRKVFTLAIPCVLAIIFFYFAFHTGYASVYAIGTGFGPVAPSNSSVSLKIEEYDLLSGNGTAASFIKTVTSPNVLKERLDIVVVLTPVIAFAPFAIDVSRIDRRTRKYEEDFAAFLFELSELVRGGIDPTKAYLTLAEKSTGSITRFVQTSAKQMQIGFSFEEAMRNLGDQINTDLVKRYIDLVIQASYSGGSVSGLIQKASADMSTFIAIDKEKRSGLAQYTMVLYTGQIILIALAVILVIQFLPSLSEISSIGSTGIGGLLSNADIGSVSIERDLFYLILINGFLGGLVIGKISEGKLKFGLKHSLILIVIALVAWSVFVTPNVSSAQQLHISVVSFDKEAPVGYPLLSPLVVRVTTAQGTPTNGTYVYFSIAPGGSVTPKLATTQGNGTASTDIVLGDTPGVYSVTVQAGSSEIVVPILAQNTNSS